MSDETADAMAAEVVGDHVALPVVGQMPAAEDFQAAMLRAAGIEAVQDARHVVRRRIAGARHDVVDALAAGAVGDERLAPAVEVMAPRIPEAAHEDLQLQRLRPELPDAAGVEVAHAVRRLDVAVNVDRLVEIQHPVRAPAEGVDDVMRVLGAEAGQDDAAFAGLAVGVGVGEEQQVGAVGDVDAAVAGLDAGGDEQAVGEDA